MNHTSTVNSVSAQAKLASQLEYTGIPFILGETNSLYNEGKPGLSNSFGAALWGLDFNLYCASVNISRVHMHQGTNFRYASWQPIDTNITTKGTKAPYYGNVAVAAFLGDATKSSIRVSNIPLSSPFDAAYAAYVDGHLARIAIINLREYNYTINGTSSVLNPVKRPQQSYTFEIDSKDTSVGVKRLYANGSDALSGITWDGWSYNYELNEGRPVRLRNVTTGEKVRVVKKEVAVSVPDSSAVVLVF